MQKTKPLKSLSIFFPFYNDAGTVMRAVQESYKVGAMLTNRLEVIAIIGGASHDATSAEVYRAKRAFPQLSIIDRSNNPDGYAVIKYGLIQARGDWVFYTDGDLQYALVDLIRLVKKQRETGADVVNGCKIKRGDRTVRTVLGELYKTFTKVLFASPIQDPTCDFRLMRRSYLARCPLFSTNASICIELVKELQYAGALFAEVPVRHRKRSYGMSNYRSATLVIERLLGDILLWLRLRKRYNR